MYTWGYLKDVSLAKLDLDESEANNQQLLSRFPFYANEVITQICSSIKPKYSYQEFVIDENNVGVPQNMNKDFVSFGDDVCYELKMEPFGGNDYLYNDFMEVKKELHDCDFEYHGYNQIIFKRPGKFYISYNARWITFSKNMDNKFELNVPMDILDCIPSYIASQCYKIDDEYKSSVFRNEYEMMLARIDNTNFKNSKTFRIEGDW